MPEISHKYGIFKAHGRWYGVVAGRDEHEVESKEDALEWVFAQARAAGEAISYNLLDSYFYSETPAEKTAKADAELLADIKAGRKKVLPADHWFFRLGLVNAPEPTQAEYNMATDRVIVRVSVPKNCPLQYLP